MLKETGRNCKNMMQRIWVYLDLITSAILILYLYEPYNFSFGIG